MLLLSYEINYIYFCSNFYGYVQIRPTTFEEIISNLNKVGCTEDGKECHYILGKKNNSCAETIHGTSSIRNW